MIAKVLEIMNNLAKVFKPVQIQGKKSTQESCPHIFSSNRLCLVTQGVLYQLPVHKKIYSKY